MIAKDIGRENKQYRTLGLVGRFKPLHKGGYALITSACEKAENIIIGIGSVNKYNLRNPFTPEEVEGMLHAVLKPEHTNYNIVRIQDFAHIPEYANGKHWAECIAKEFGLLDAFISGNSFVEGLLKHFYSIINPCKIIPPERWIKLCATEVRVAMASHNDWQSLVPDRVADYLENQGLVSLFQREFGLQTLAMLASGKDYRASEDGHAENLHAQEK